MFRLGLVINPVAGVGGPAAMKGSDGSLAQDTARSLGIEPRAGARARDTFVQLSRLLSEHVPPTPESDREQLALQLFCPAGPMGAGAFAAELELAVEWVGRTGASTTAEDTTALVAQILPQVDLLVFVGGDGTARDVLDACEQIAEAGRTPVLGVPAGVKMHSGVFATSPHAAAHLLYELVTGGLVGATHAEVKDIDEAALRRGQVGSRTYGELLVPAQGGYLQHVKSGGKEVEALVLLEIAADVTEYVAALDQVLVIGPGSTCYAIKQELLGEVEPTLLGFDVVQNGKLLLKDATAPDLQRLLGEFPELEVLLSFSRNQGFLLGRGNQQLNAAVLTSLTPAQIRVVSSRSKLATLAGRPLLVDSGTAELDQKFSGLIQIISGYQDKLLYLVQPA